MCVCVCVCVCVQDKLVRTEREQHERDVSSLAEERDQLQEKLQGVGWEREAGEGEEEGKSPFSSRQGWR